jgi:hypothetical protein
MNPMSPDALGRAMADLDEDRISRAFAGAVNMTAAEIEAWLERDESRRVGWTRPGESESVGRASGRRIAAILRMAPGERIEDDVRHMRKVAGFIARHRAQRPENIVTSRWRYSLMNWGHDPLKELDP